MKEAAEQALANFRHEQALAQTHQRRADGYLTQFLSLIGDKVSDQPSGQTVRCVREWTRWLAENGPELKPIITEETGIKFTERGTPHTFLWDESMADEPDDAYPPNAIMRIQGPKGEGPNRGRPPMVYFLWSQRWDVHPLFGVGPIKGEPSDSYPDAEGLHYLRRATKPIELTAEDEEMVAGLLYDQVETEDDLFPFPDSGTVTEEVTPRFATMDEWNFTWGALLSDLAQSGSKPTPEDRQAMLDSLPEGKGYETLALAYSAAVRGPAPIMGVAHPPASAYPIHPDEGEEIAIDWDDIPRPEPEPDRTGWEMVGNHNHLPHAWSDLCAVSQCQRIA